MMRSRFIPASMTSTSVANRDRNCLPNRSSSAPHHGSGHEGIAQANEIAFHYPVLFVGAVILAHKGGAGQIEARHHVINKCVGVGGGGIALHHHRIKGIHGGLDEQIRHSENGILQACRDAQHQQISCHMAVRLHFSFRTGHNAPRR